MGEQVMKRPPPGTVRQPTGEQLTELARSHGAEAIDTIVQIMRHSASEKTRLVAALALLDRGFGRVPAAGMRVIDVPQKPALVQHIDHEPPSEPAADFSPGAHREARVKVLELLNQHPSKSFTAPDVVAVTGLKGTAVAAILVQLHRDGHIDRRGQGTFQAKKQ